MSKVKFYLLGAVLFLFLLLEPVYAVTYEEGTCYYFNRTTGAYASSGGRDCVKKINGKYAYCVQWSLPFGVGKNYKLDTAWRSNTKTAIIAGLMIDIANEEVSGTVKAYEMTAAVLNTYFSKVINSSSSKNFYSKNSTVKKIYDQAYEEYKKVDLSTSLSKPKFSYSDVLNSASSSVFISDKITLSGLEATHGGDSDKVQYTITPSVASGTAVICSNASGTSCTSTVTFSGRSADYPFYIKATGVKEGATVSVKVAASNASVYPTTIRYAYAANKQKVLQRDTVTISRSAVETIQLTVPNLTNHTITGYKVDENGDLLTGAALELYRDDTTVASNLLAKNNGSSATVQYSSPIVSENDDDFLKHNYYFVEKSAPDGYVLNSTVKNIYIYDPNVSLNTNSKICYYNGDDQTDAVVVDSERCNFSAYEYKCLASNSDTPIDLSENENCDFSSTDSSTEETSPANIESSDTTEDGDSTGGGESSGEEGTTPPVESEITYEKVCYNLSKNQVVSDVTYCSDKGKYTLVSKTSGNLVVKQSNVKNSVKISKRAITGEDEVAGATLKICTASDYESKKENCDPAKTISDVELSWTSGTSPNEFVGLKKGSYYVIEVTPPSGYIKTTIATQFSIDEYGVVKSGDVILEDNMVVIKNQINSVTISKQDMATSAELPGATISICLTYKDDDGNIKLLTDQYDNECIPARLHDGTEATWVSTVQPKVLSGLPAGTYYLVERIAPDKYSTAESILFVLKEDGTLTDKDGNLLKDSKLVMHDKKIEEVKTGMLPFYIVGGTLIVVVGLGIGSYYYMNKNSSKILQKNQKIRKRKVYKKSFKD